MVKKLIDGFKDFRESFFGTDKKFDKNFETREHKPKTMIIACSDARVDPAILFDSNPGELFVLRNVANLVPPHCPNQEQHGVSAAIEYAVLELGIREIVVLGHAFCGGINVLKSQVLGKTVNPLENVEHWMKIAEPAKSMICKSMEEHELSRELEWASIKNSLQNLNGFPWINELVAIGELKLYGWWFDMDNGAVWSCGNGDKEFSQIIPEIPL